MAPIRSRNTPYDDATLLTGSFPNTRTCWTSSTAILTGWASSIESPTTLARAMRHAGYDVFTEWIINDAGSQIDALGRSLYARYRQLFDPAYPFPEDGYPGDYLIPIAEKKRPAAISGNNRCRCSSVP